MGGGHGICVTSNASFTTPTHSPLIKSTGSDLLSLVMNASCSLCKASSPLDTVRVFCKISFIELEAHSLVDIVSRA